MPRSIFTHLLIFVACTTYVVTAYKIDREEEQCVYMTEYERQVRITTRTWRQKMFDYDVIISDVITGAHRNVYESLKSSFASRWVRNKWKWRQKANRKQLRCDYKYSGPASGRAEVTQNTHDDVTAEEEITGRIVWAYWTAGADHQSKIQVLLAS